MLLLTGTSDLVQVTTSAAADIEVHASCLDVTGTPQVVTPVRINTASITSATTTTVVGSPAASTQRNVKTLNITNNHASVSCFVLVQHTDGTNVVALMGVTLLPGENMIFDQSGRWTHYDAAGAAYVVATSGPVTVKGLASDQSNSTTTPTEVVGLTMPLAVGTHYFQYAIRYQSAAATTGVKFDVNYTGTVTSFVWNQNFVGLVATASDANPDQDSILAAAAVMNAFSSRAKGTAGRGVTLSVDTLNADMLMLIEGLAVVTVVGNLALWHGSEVAAASTVKAGSALVVFKVA